MVVLRAIDWSGRNGPDYIPDWKAILGEWNESGGTQLTPELLAGQILVEMPGQQRLIEAAGSDEEKLMRIQQMELLQSSLEQILTQFGIEKPEVI